LTTEELCAVRSRVPESLAWNWGATTLDPGLPAALSGNPVFTRFCKRATLLEVNSIGDSRLDMPERKSLPVIVLIGAIVGLASMATICAFLIDAPHLLLLERQHADTIGR
jgi:hypothetical protein